MVTSMLEAMVVGSDVVVIWQDGHESYYPGEALRRACTCASCQGEEHLFGRRTPAAAQALVAASFQPIAVSRVGNYGLQVTWADGHDYGIYHLDALRAACPCEACRGAAGNTPS